MLSVMGKDIEFNFSFLLVYTHLIGFAEEWFRLAWNLLPVQPNQVCWFLCSQKHTQRTSNCECMRQYRSVQRTLEQGLGMHLKYANGSGAALGSTTLVRSGCHSPAPCLCGSAASKGFSSHQCDGETWAAQVSRYHSTDMSLFTLTVRCACQFSYQVVQTILCSEAFGIIQDVVILVEPCADGNCQLETKFGCLQCLFPSGKCWQQGALCSAAFEENPSLL